MDNSDSELISVTVRELGSTSGPDVVFIPGLASSASVWDDMWSGERPKIEARTHIIQIAGFGSTPAATAPNVLEGDGFIEAIAGELAQYLIAEKLEDVRIVGHSMGGVIALETARLRPDAVSGVVVVDALPYYPVLFQPDADPLTFGPSADAMTAQMRAMPDGAYAAMQAQSAAIYSKDDRARARIVADGLASDRETVLSAMDDLLRTDLRPKLSAIPARVTVVHAADPAMGRPDGAMRALFAREYAGLPNKTIVTVEDSFHFIMHDQPNAFWNAVKEAIK